MGARGRSCAILAAAISIGTFTVSMTGWADEVMARALLFYAATSLAYLLMPFVRRGDIPLVATWVVLASELAPLVAGRMIEPRLVAADFAGIVLAATPIYIARARQVMQGDTRYGARRRRESVEVPAQEQTGCSVSSR